MEPLEVVLDRFARLKRRLGPAGHELLWREFWGEQATIFGIDINPACAGRVDPQTAQVRIGSQADPDFLRSVVADMGGELDVVLDDGSHVASHQRASMHTLWPYLRDGGLYLIEDTHTSYWNAFEGGLRRRGTIIEDMKDLVDEMHGWYHGGKRRVAPFDRDDVASVMFFDSIIAIEKRRRRPPQRTAIGSVE